MKILREKFFMKTYDGNSENQPLGETLPLNDLTSGFEVSPVIFALVHLNKPFDVAMIAQTVASTCHVRVDLVGQSIDFDHPKVVTKLKSWVISDPVKLLSGKSSQYESIDDLKQKNRESRLIGAVVTGGSNPFQYEWEDNDIIVIGGANGLSRQDVEQMDDTITIPTVPEVEFLTVSTVVSSLTYHILTQRGLWNKLARG